MTSEPGKQTVAMHILSNTSGSKGNRTINFGHLIECKMRNTFLEKSCTNCGEETIPRFFSKKLKLNLFLDQWSKVLYSLFLLHVNLKAVEKY